MARPSSRASPRRQLGARERAEFRAVARFAQDGLGHVGQAKGLIEPKALKRTAPAGSYRAAGASKARSSVKLTDPSRHPGEAPIDGYIP